MSYRLLLSSFRGPTVWLPDNQKGTSFTSIYDEHCIQKYGRIVPQKDWVKSYDFVCPKCETPYGVFFMPYLRSILGIKSPPGSRKQKYANKVAIDIGHFPDFKQVLIEDKTDDTVSVNMEYVNQLPLDIICKAIDEASSVVNALARRELFKQTRLLLSAGLEKLVVFVGLPKVVAMIQQATAAKKSKEVVDYCKCGIQWCQLIPAESVFSAHVDKIKECMAKLSSPTVSISVDEFRKAFNK